VTSLESLAPCFQGLIPAWLCTCSRDGVPNAAILSHVDYVDPRHLALSHQFFNKSKRNIAENPKALVRLLHPDTFQAYALRVRFVRTETAGPLFDSMRLRIEAIASYSGLKGIFKLLGADIYEVLSIDAVEHEVGRPGGAPPSAAAGRAGAPFTLAAMQDLSERIQRAPTLDLLLDDILEGLERTFGFRHSMILLASEVPERLQLIASRGYPEGGVGSEVGFGEGIIGMVAESRKPVRISGVLRQMLYANAVAERARERGLRPADRRIRLPGLAEPESQLGIPLLAHGELVGVLCIEADEPYRFHEEDREYLEVLGRFLALAIENALLRERDEATQEPAAPAPSPPAPAGQKKVAVEYFAADECVLVDGEYLVRGLPARILWKLLVEHRSTGQTEFTNRRLRLDKSLELSSFKDNLESRLILLRRRLEERCPWIRLVPSGRGRFRLELRGEVALAERP
jgi:hypothetical protein